MKDYVKSITINHAYHSTFTMGSFSSNLDYDPAEPEVLGKDVVPQYRIQDINITEQFNPLIGIDIGWQKNWTSNFEYRTARNVSFSFANYQTTQISSREFVVGIGWKTKEMKLPFKVRKKKTILQHEVTFRLDMSIKDDKSMIYKLDEGLTQAVGGSQTFALAPRIDYLLSKNLKASLFFKRNVNTPIISTSFPTAFTSIGFSFTYTL